MEKDYSKMTIEELEKEVSDILKMQHRQDDLFRAVVLMGQLELAKYIYHEKNTILKTGHINQKQAN